MFMRQRRVKGTKKVCHGSEGLPSATVNRALKLARYESRDAVVKPDSADFVPPGLMQILSTPSSRAELDGYTLIVKLSSPHGYICLSVNIKIRRLPKCTIVGIQIEHCASLYEEEDTDRTRASERKVALVTRS